MAFPMRAIKRRGGDLSLAGGWRGYLTRSCGEAQFGISDRERVAVIVLVGRILLGALFVLAGIGKIGGIEGFTQMVEGSGFPGVLAWPAIIFEIVAGSAVIAGFFTRYAALALAAFCLFTGVVFHYVPADQMQMAMMMKNLGLAGGFLILYSHGPGPLSIDARRGGTE